MTDRTVGANLEEHNNPFKCKLCGCGAICGGKHEKVPQLMLEQRNFWEFEEFLDYFPLNKKDREKVISLTKELKKELGIPEEPISLVPSVKLICRSLPKDEQDAFVENYNKMLESKTTPSQKSKKIACQIIDILENTPLIKSQQRVLEQETDWLKTL